MSEEIELKLRLPRRALAAFRRHPVFAGADRAGPTTTLDNTYYDTAELALKERGIALRTRHQGRTRVQTVKCAAPSTGGLTRRPEWEVPFSGSFDFSAVDDRRVARILKRFEPELEPVFTTRFRRETRVYAPDDATRILIMADNGTIATGAHTEPLCEIELELERGRPLDLLLLACRLVADVPLLPEDESKAARGYRLHLDIPRQPLRSEPSSVTRGQTPVEAFRELAFACVRQWQHNAAGAAEHDDPEFIHQLRVSQRRLRSLIRLFRPALPDAFAIDWSQRLRANANSFGDARDLDVLYDEILAPASGSEPAVARLTAIVAERRDAARQRARAQLDPAAQGRLLVGFMAALHALPTSRLIDAADLRTFARLQLARVRKRIRGRWRAAQDLSPPHLHALRIAMKRLRYGVEFFAPLMPAKAARRYLKSLARVQNALGYIHDVDVARDTLAAIAGDDPPLRAAVAFVGGWHAARYARMCRRAIREAEPLLHDPAPWGRTGDGPASKRRS